MGVQALLDEVLLLEALEVPGVCLHSVSVGRCGRVRGLLGPLHDSGHEERGPQDYRGTLRLLETSVSSPTGRVSCLGDSVSRLQTEGGCLRGF